MKTVVSGTSRGLGLAIANDLVEHHEVLGFARGECTDRSARFEHIAGVDATDRDTWARLAPHLAEADALINNVGVGLDSVFAVQTPADIDQLIDLNLRSIMLASQAYIRERMSRRKSGVIVNISSIVGIRGFSGLTVYSATKAGVDGFTRSLAREMGRRGFRINSVLPGYLETDMSATLSDQRRKQITGRTPLGRLGTVADITPVVRFLISDGARYITGTRIVVDGGSTC